MKRLENFKVAYSKEEPIKNDLERQIKGTGKSQVPGSVSFVPSVAGLIIAGEVVKDIIKLA